MATVSLKNVTKLYSGGILAVDRANITIQDEEFVVLVGPSGCGKSTTLRMIAGLEKITSGDLYLDDRRINDLPPKNRDMAMVFQNYALYPHMNIYENMAFGLRIKKIPKDEIHRRVEDAAQILRIQELLDRRPRELSGGQRQRVAVGRAIVRNPKVFLFDEPLSNLDAKLRMQTRVELSDLHQRLKTTMIYVTHDQVEAMTMGDRIVVMKDGLIQQIDTPLGLYNRPANLFVAGFIGSPSMNFFEAVLEKAADRFSCRVGEFRLPVPIEKATVLNAFVGKKIILGVRPECLLLDTHMASEGAVKATVKVIESLGVETIVYADMPQNRLVAKLPPDREIRIGETVAFRLVMDRVRFFDPKTRQAVC